MKKEHHQILELLKSYLKDHPDQRFGQAIFNLGINQFQETIDPRHPNYALRDIHNDGDDEIVKRMKRQIEWFELQQKVNEGISKAKSLEATTVNERLYLTGLMDLFEKYKETEVEFAKFILKSIGVDYESIDQILS